MPIITPTADNIRVEPTTAQGAGKAAVAIERFQLVYESDDGTRIGINTTEAAAEIAGISYTSSEIGDLVRYVANNGQIRSTTSLWTPSEFYFVSADSGKMCTWDEVATDKFATLVGYAISATVFNVKIIPTRLPRLAAPINTVAPVVSGTTAVGETLTCTTGTWTGSATISYTYQWQRDTGSGFSNIGGATASTRVLTGDDELNDIRCVVTATNSAGSASANSNEVGPINP